MKKASTSKKRRVSGFSVCERVRAIYRRAVRDQNLILGLWPNARQHKKRVVSALGFSQDAVEWMKQRGSRASAIERTRRTHQETIKSLRPKLTSYRPAELMYANLQQCWVPLAELLLELAAKLRGEDFAGLRPQLEKKGFPKEILNVFKDTQRRKYFLQQTPDSVAGLIAARLNPEKVAEDSIRRAQKRLY